MANLIYAILMMKLKGNDSKPKGVGCGKTRMDGGRIYLQSYTSYAIRNREFCNLIFVTSGA